MISAFLSRRRAIPVLKDDSLGIKWIGSVSERRMTLEDRLWWDKFYSQQRLTPAEPEDPTHD